MQCDADDVVVLCLRGSAGSAAAAAGRDSRYSGQVRMTRDGFIIHGIITLACFLSLGLWL